MENSKRRVDARRFETFLFTARITADQNTAGSKFLLRSKMAEQMADGGEQVLVENGKEDERELDLAKCAAEFAHYCQVDVRKEV